MLNRSLLNSVMAIEGARVNADASHRRAADAILLRKPWTMDPVRFLSVPSYYTQAQHLLPQSESLTILEDETKNCRSSMNV